MQLATTSQHCEFEERQLRLVLSLGSYDTAKLWGLLWVYLSAVEYKTQIMYLCAFVEPSG